MLSPTGAEIDLLSLRLLLFSFFSFLTASNLVKLRLGKDGAQGVFIIGITKIFLNNGSN